MNTPCGSRSSLDTVPRPMRGAPSSSGANQAVVVGGLTIHESHELSWEPDLLIWYCRTCGRTATHQVRALHKKCSGVLDKKGRDNLGRVSRGLLPGDSREAKRFNDGRLAVKRRARPPADLPHTQGQG